MIAWDDDAAEFFWSVVDPRDGWDGYDEPTLISCHRPQRIDG